MIFGDSNILGWHLRLFFWWWEVKDISHTIHTSPGFILVILININFCPWVVSSKMSKHLLVKGSMVLSLAIFFHKWFHTHSRHRLACIQIYQFWNDWSYAVQTKKKSNNDMGVSKNRGTPKSSILIGFSLTNHPFWGKTPPIFGNIHINTSILSMSVFG